MKKIVAAKARNSRDLPLPAPVEVPTAKLVQMAKAKRSPVIEGNQATFFYYKPASDVELVGEMTGWEAKGLKLKQYQSEKFWALTLNFPRDARLEYKFAVDQGDWGLDPANSLKVDNGLGGENSWFPMPDTPEVPELKPTPIAVKGKLVDMSFTAKAIPGKRRVTVYVPPMASRGPLPVLYVQDGGEYISRAKLNVVLDNLIAAHRIQPVIAVCIDPGDRNKEYWFDDRYLDMLTQEIIPMIDAKFQTIKTSEGRGMLGASLGGLTAAYAAYRHPDIFHNILSQSGAFWVDDDRILKMVEAKPMPELHWALHTGRYESILFQNQDLLAILKKQGQNPFYLEQNEGHNWTHWARTLPPVLTSIYGKGNGALALRQLR